MNAARSVRFPRTNYTGKPRPVVLQCQMKNAGMRSQFRLSHSVDGYSEG
jgi:hypothetical protein